MTNQLIAAVSLVGFLSYFVYHKAYPKEALVEEERLPLTTSQQPLDETQVDSRCLTYEEYLLARQRPPRPSICGSAVETAIEAVRKRTYTAQLSEEDSRCDVSAALGEGHGSLVGEAPPPGRVQLIKSRWEAAGSI